MENARRSDFTRGDSDHWDALSFARATEVFRFPTFHSEP
jgi:hypothetical protein